MFKQLIEACQNHGKRPFWSILYLRWVNLTYQMLQKLQLKLRLYCHDRKQCSGRGRAEFLHNWTALKTLTLTIRWLVMTGIDRRRHSRPPLWHLLLSGWATSTQSWTPHLPEVKRCSFWPRGVQTNREKEWGIGEESTRNLWFMMCHEMIHEIIHVDSDGVLYRSD